MTIKRNIMSVDLEDFYCGLPISDWSKYEPKIVETTRPLLALLDKYKATATFFTVGWIAEHFPQLVEEVKSKGHEIASHGYSHPNIFKMNKDSFESDLVKSLAILQKISGEKVLGFRAPYLSINKQNFWAFDVLRRHLRYDSSLAPVKFHYGLPDAPRFIYRMSEKDPLRDDPNSNFTEIPLTTLRLPIMGNLPVGGGHYLRFLPISVLKSAIRKFNKSGFPAICYIHPHDLDPAKPRIPNTAWHNYWGLKDAARKFESVLQDFKFASVQEVMAF